MRVGAGRAEVVVGDELQDVWRAEFGNSAVAVEGIMVRLESFDGTHGARATRRRRVIGRGRMRRFEFGAGMGVPHCLNAHGGRAEVEVIEGWV